MEDEEKDVDGGEGWGSEEVGRADMARPDDSSSKERRTVADWILKS